MTVMNDFAESSRLDRVRFSITQKEDTEADLLLMLVLGGLYGVPVVLGILVVLLGLEVSAAVSGLVVVLGVAMGLAAAVAVIIRLRERRTVILEIGAGGLVLNGARLSMADTSIVLQRLAFSQRSVLAVHNHRTGQQQNLGGLLLTTAQHIRIQQVLDDALRDAEKREGGTVPAMLQQLREKRDLL